MNCSEVARTCPATATRSDQTTSCGTYGPVSGEASMPVAAAGGPPTPPLSTQCLAT